jgi:serine/threonine protein kinase
MKTDDMSTASPNPGARERELFIETLEQPTPAAQAAFLDQACGADAGLRRRLEALLRRFENLGTFMAEPVGGESRPIEPTPGAAMSTDASGNVPLTEQPGQRIGRYKLLQKLGEGGMGAVWMAEQEEPVRRKVALKIIKLGMDTREVIARFEAERQALAMMDHPNIAKFFDAGVTGGSDARNADCQSAVSPTGSRQAAGESQATGASDAPQAASPATQQTGSLRYAPGRPYFVMELVPGIRLTDYCDQNKLSTRERLELFAKVCLGVQHAHQKGIIHRDLKPSNILVTLHDGVPVPKVIDFGIAKATGQRLTDKTLFTQLGAMLGTPAYMSPEQAELSGLDIDTRSDIYSLGVLFYQLLTGRPPFDPRNSWPRARSKCAARSAKRNRRRPVPTSPRWPRKTWPLWPSATPPKRPSW